MFLERRAFKRILITAICFVATVQSFPILKLFIQNEKIINLIPTVGGAILLIGAYLVYRMVINDGLVKWGRMGSKLIHDEKKPSEFLKLYERLTTSDEFIIKKERLEIFQFVQMSHNVLGEGEKCLEASDKLISLSNKKQKAWAYLMKVGCLYDMGEDEKAEALFNYAKTLKFNYAAASLYDALNKSERSRRQGDYKTAEQYWIKILEQNYPKLSAIDILIANYNLGEIYEQTNEKEKAIFHYNYCIENCGETIFGEKARQGIERLQQEAAPTES